ncbi:protein AATF isoform X1 [Syngnathoides biaculeatus]|uniref:protein AATF isoform X1 n=1 Tax=Syngnathoides biaculeatus TaxID=300417 RepID=UPI002ADDB42D|nr:protein AATF isoform X1 [Syngnathoides biaculeatus]
MASACFSRELQDLLNPLPKFADPEDDHDEATRARVSDAFAGDVVDEEAGGGFSALRRRNDGDALAEDDGRYLGKAVSRRQLRDQDQDRDGEDEDEEDGSLEELEEDEEEAESEADLHEPTGATDDGEGDPMEEDEDGLEEEDGGGGAISTFSKEKLDEEVEKGQAVRKQLALWEQLLEARIKMQKALASANRLPRPHALPRFRDRGGPRLAGAAKDARKALKALQRSLLDLQELLGRQSAVPVLPGRDDEDEDGGAARRKTATSAYPEEASRRFAAFRPYRDATLRKWHDRTRLGSGKRGGFGAFERDVVVQVEQILTDKERLVRRTQTRRSEYRVLGDAADPSERNLDGPAPSRGDPTKDADEDVFDDDDFYHQLLRELIERKTGGADGQVAAGRRWLQIQKLRSKIKKKVDTKASKGRKVRFDAHPKLLNFMAPVVRDDEALAHDARTELYRGLFGPADAARL